MKTVITIQNENIAKALEMQSAIVEVLGYSIVSIVVPNPDFDELNMFETAEPTAITLPHDELEVTIVCGDIENTSTFYRLK